MRRARVSASFTSTPSGSALAWVGLADAYSRIAFSYQPEGDWYARAEAACERALALDPALPEGRYVRGRLRGSPQAGFDPPGAIRDFIAAIQGRPGLEDAYRCLSEELYHVGLLEEAQRELEQALALAPDHVLARLNLGFCRFLQARYAEALEMTEGAARRAAAAIAAYQTTHSTTWPASTRCWGRGTRRSAGSAMRRGTDSPAQPSSSGTCCSPPSEATSASNV